MGQFIFGFLFAFATIAGYNHLNPAPEPEPITIERCVTLESKQLRCTLSDGRIEFPIHGRESDPSRDVWANYGKSVTF